jgi:hypothetical protein
MATGVFSGEPSSPSAALLSYRVELPHELLDADEHLLDWVLDFAFETLDARHLELRIIAETCSDPYQTQGA